MRELALTRENVKELKFRLDQALSNLNVAEPSAPPASVVDAVEKFVDEWQDAKRASGRSRPDEASVEDVAFGLGAAWGEQFVRQFGWEWITLQEDKHHYFAVAAPDRALTVYPIDFMRACLVDPEIDCTAMLAFNMLIGGKVPALPANGYEDLMQGVHRIVPKR